MILFKCIFQIFSSRHITFWVPLYSIVDGWCMPPISLYPPTSHALECNIKAHGSRFLASHLIGSLCC